MTIIKRLHSTEQRSTECMFHHCYRANDNISMVLGFHGKHGNLINSPGPKLVNEMNIKIYIATL